MSGGELMESGLLVTLEQPRQAVRSFTSVMNRRP
jgi:hypothetical protein